MVERKLQRCKHCGKQFFGLVRDFCTTQCRDAVNQKIGPQDKPCEFCGEIFRGKSTKKYCSGRCESRARHAFEPPVIEAEPQYLPRRSPVYHAGKITSSGHLKRSPLSSKPLEPPCSSTQTLQPNSEPSSGPNSSLPSEPLSTTD